MSRLLVTIFAIALCVCSSNAQDKKSLLERVNEIKAQTDEYLWDQYTCPNADSSRVNAAKRLLLHVNDYHSETEQLTVDDILPKAKYINIDRGYLKQSFVYIKISDAISLGGVTKNQPAKANNDKGIIPATSDDKAFVPDAFVQRIMEVKTFMNVHKVLKSMQAQGQVLQYGKLRDVEDYSSFDLILFDMQSQEVITLLSPVTPSGSRINMVNGADDSLDNYPTNMTAVIWYIKK